MRWRCCQRINSVISLDLHHQMIGYNVWISFFVLFQYIVRITPFTNGLQTESPFIREDGIVNEYSTASPQNACSCAFPFSGSESNSNSDDPDPAIWGVKWTYVSPQNPGQNFREWSDGGDPPRSISNFGSSLEGSCCPIQNLSSYLISILSDSPSSCSCSWTTALYGRLAHFCRKLSPTIPHLDRRNCQEIIYISLVKIIQMDNLRLRLSECDVVEHNFL